MQPTNVPPTQPTSVPPRQLTNVPAQRKFVLASAIAAVAAFAVGGVGGYALYEHRAAEVATAEQQQLTDQLMRTRAQIDELTGKVDALAARPEPQPVAVPQPSEAPIAAKALPKRATGESQRLKKMQSQLDRQNQAIDEQGKAIATTQSQLASTQGDLANTRTELSGSIAHTHDELVLLQKKGERNYYEFDIAKSKQFTHEGPLGVRLRKANTKHQFADLDLIVEDQTVSQKHVNLYQPAMFSMPDSAQPSELVINSITKDRIHGYVSSPKYRRSELASSATSPAPNQVADTQPSQRQTLPQPK